jgi:adenylosuccinate synthase
MSNEDMPPPRLLNNADETNITNEWQGEFRKTTLDADLLNYALLCDSHFAGDCPKNLVVTCLDQTQGQIPFTAQEGKVRGQTIAQLLAQLRTNFGEVWQSRSPESTLECWT